MIKELNLQCQYKVFLDTESFKYFFTTESQIEYSVFFSDCDLYEDTLICECKAFFITIEVTTGKPKSIDVEIQKTIEEIVIDFFSDKQRLLVYYCANADKKGFARNRKFNQWYNSSQYKNEILKIDNKFEDLEKNKHYVTLLYHKLNSKQNLILQTQKELIKELDK